MTTNNPQEMKTVLLESKVEGMLQQMEEVQVAIMQTVPEETLRTLGGDINLRNRWGSVLWHIRQVRATLRGLGF